MILVDTSVWVAHLRTHLPGMCRLLEDSQVLTHSFVIGELACGNLRDRAAFLGDLKELPGVLNATHEDVLNLIESRKLWGHGIGWIDGHLIASSLLSKCAFWTLDSRLAGSARLAGVKAVRSLVS